MWLVTPKQGARYLQCPRVSASSPVERHALLSAADGGQLVAEVLPDRERVALER